MQPFGRNRYGPKNKGLPLWGGGAGSGHNVARAEAYLHAKFHLDPSNRLATVHERHRQTDRQRSDSIGRTVLQTVAQKPKWFTRPQTITHPSTNRARRRVTSLIETTALQPSQM